MEQFVVYTDQGIFYSRTGTEVSWLVTDGGSDRHSVLYYWLIPNRNTKDGIRIKISLV